LSAAIREFTEETGMSPIGEFLELSPIKQPGGKIVHAWALEGDFNVADLLSNNFDLEWPRGSGNVEVFPEIDRAGWFGVRTAKLKIVKGQAGFIDQLLERLR
jgi:predicted NUDIX family NTP pyrophosphohydrolase